MYGQARRKTLSIDSGSDALARLIVLGGFARLQIEMAGALQLLEHTLHFRFVLGQKQRVALGRGLNPPGLLLCSRGRGLFVPKGPPGRAVDQGFTGIPPYVPQQAAAGVRITGVDQHQGAFVLERNAYDERKHRHGIQTGDLVPWDAVAVQAKMGLVDLDVRQQPERKRKNRTEEQKGDSDPGPRPGQSNPGGKRSERQRGYTGPKVVAGGLVARHRGWHNFRLPPGIPSVNPKSP